MAKKRKDVTILSVGDPQDYDSYNKLHAEKEFVEKSGFHYRTLQYKDLAAGIFPDIPTRKVIVFVFFPFEYWNHRIEHRHYRGVYGNLNFYRKFNRFCGDVKEVLLKNMPGRKILFINDPSVSSLYRDKLLAMKTLRKAGVPISPITATKSVRKVRDMLCRGHKFFIKPRCGSMGKGMTFLELGNWQTNFTFRKNRILSRKSDSGWKFHDITENTRFLGKLLRKDVFIEDAVEPLNIKGDKVDFRVYIFMNKVVYVYPRRNGMDSVTTNISQGGRGDPELLDILPEKLLSRILYNSRKAMKALGLKFAGMDVIVDNMLKHIYIVDVNMFPGMPKRKTFNLARYIIKDLKERRRRGRLRYEKSDDL